jgi:hypothetical protein
MGCSTSGQKVRRKEDKAMAEQILVALKSHDRLSRMVPYIEEIARPGMKVILLIPFATQTGLNATRSDSRAPSSLDEERTIAQLDAARGTSVSIRGAQLIDEQNLRAEHKLFLALERLLSKGIDITVDLYTGSLRTVVKNYTAKGHVHLIMKRAGRTLMMMQFFFRSVPKLVLLKQPSFSSIRTLRAN